MVFAWCNTKKVILAWYARGMDLVSISVFHFRVHQWKSENTKLLLEQISFEFSRYHSSNYQEY